MSTIDLLVFGPHPDDIEFFCGGTILRAVEEGLQVVLADLTRGERASRGTPEIRAREAAAAAAVLGVTRRENLELPDLGLRADDPEQVGVTVDIIRRLRPAMVLAPPPRARHPDHQAASELVRRACFVAGVRGHATEHAPHRVAWLGNYVMRHRVQASFLVDTSGTRTQKRKAIEAYASQFGPFMEKDDRTLIGAEGSIEAIEARDRYHGACIGVETAEPLVLPGPLGLPGLSALRALRAPRFFFEERS
ncbi:MAG: bacillithiol biosynthesis deacetylase BshB1 [Myxococcota bacterium]